MKDLSSTVESGADSNEFSANDAHLQQEMQSHFESNVIPFKEKVGKDAFDRKVESRKFTTGVEAETMDLLDKMYNVRSWKEGYDKITQLRAEKDFLLSTMIAKAQNALGIGEVSKQVLALETQISNLASLVKRLPAEKEILAMKNPDAENVEVEKEIEFSESSSEADNDDNNIEYKQAA